MLFPLAITPREEEGEGEEEEEEKVDQNHSAAFAGPAGCPIPLLAGAPNPLLGCPNPLLPALYFFSIFAIIYGERSGREGVRVSVGRVQSGMQKC